MQAKNFQALVEQLGELTTAQREALVDAITTKSSVNDVIRMIDRDGDDASATHYLMAAIA